MLYWGKFPSVNVPYIKDVTVTEWKANDEVEEFTDEDVVEMITNKESMN